MIQTNSSEPLVHIIPGKIIHTKSAFKTKLIRLMNEIHTSYFLNKSELKSRIFGKSLGIFTLAIDPIFQSLTYYFLTAVIFKGVVQTSFLSLYTIVIFWQLFSKPFQNACTALSANSGIIKQTNFPLRIVFFSFFSLEFILWLINLAVLIVFLAFNGVIPNLNWIFLVPLIITQMALTVVFSFPTAILGAYIKDLSSFIAPLVSLWFYLSPGIYNRENIPQSFRWAYDYNPFSALFDGYRFVFFGQAQIAWTPLLVIFLASCVLILVQSKVLRLLLRRIYSYI